MLDTHDFGQVRNAVELYDDRRESVIKRCRDSQKLAKQAIYSLHRNDNAKAEAQLREVEVIAKELLPMITESPFLRMGSYSASMEEYGEAMAFLVFLKEGRLVRKSELPLCDTEERWVTRLYKRTCQRDLCKLPHLCTLPRVLRYLGAILDFTGELNRFCVKAATARDKEAVKRCRDLCDAIMGEFLQFNLRNSSPRKKFDSLKYTLKKLENTLYELSLTENLGLKTLGKEEEPDAETGQGPNADVE
eukprot:CAMPEP_0202398662 /NCGR_PEP_ID=MMETSP1128-20130828/1467_1 /ASSEMBLY_ACC=CAM_ASM_000463 /TAXON_ID=3047 /ORGANISM="Dunaliella tertiolecta, Strain CCMP1320" /LENGTH=246 /DNA_ID=CAMNT_0049001845 /DNA_START=157 /DNA_END=897 /DNA_ORIENTATION=-